MIAAAVYDYQLYHKTKKGQLYYTAARWLFKNAPNENTLCRWVMLLESAGINFDISYIRRMAREAKGFNVRYRNVYRNKSGAKEAV